MDDKERIDKEFNGKKILSGIRWSVFTQLGASSRLRPGYRAYLFDIDIL